MTQLLHGSILILLEKRKGNTGKYFSYLVHLSDLCIKLVIKPHWSSFCIVFSMTVALNKLDNCFTRQYLTKYVVLLAFIMATLELLKISCLKTIWTSEILFGKFCMQVQILIILPSNLSIPKLKDPNFFILVESLRGDCMIKGLSLILTGKKEEYHS